MMRRHLLTMVAMTLILASCQGNTSRSVSSERVPTAASVETMIGEECRVSFLVPGSRLFWIHRYDLLDDVSMRWLVELGPSSETRAATFGLPQELFLRLLLVDGKRRTPVNWPADLKGHVRITTPEQAIEYVRLFSSSNTWYRFPEYRYLELIPSGSWLDALFKASPGNISDSEFSQLGLARLCIIPHEDGFRIRRSAARVSGTYVEAIYVFDETVSADGSYGLRILDYRRLRDKSVFVPFLQ